MPEFLSLLFKREGDYNFVEIQIESSKTVRDAIIAYRNKRGLMDQNIILIFNSITLREDMTLAQTGLRNRSHILVVVSKDIIGG